MFSTQTYALNLAARMVSGHAAASFCPYKQDPEQIVRALAHELSAEGTLLLFCDPEDVRPLGDVPVRVDLHRQSLEFNQVVEVASVHCLGELRWVGWADGLRIGEVTIEQAHMHWPAGHVGMDWQSLCQMRPQQDLDLFDAYQALSSIPSARLKSVHYEVLAGVTPGFVLLDVPRPLCVQQKDRFIIGDVDSCGVMLAETTRERLRVTMVAFPRPITSAEQLVDALHSVAFSGV